MSNKSQYAGADWVKSSLKVVNMSPLGEDVADLLGDVFRGIYHLKTSSLNKVEWSNKNYIVYHLHWRDLSTFDFDELTRLVVLSHDRMIRINIEAIAPHLLRLLFHKRTTRQGDIFRRMPTMENHIKIIRDEYQEVPDMPDDDVPEVVDGVDKYGSIGG